MRPSMRPTAAWTTTRATCTSPEHALRARNLCHTLFILSHMHSFGSRSESRHLSSMFMCVSPWSASPLLLRLVLPCLLLFLPPPALRAAHWARQPDRHGKPVLLLQQGEWRRLRRLHLPYSKSSERILWMTEFLNTETHTPVLLMNHL